MLRVFGCTRLVSLSLFLVSVTALLPNLGSRPHLDSATRASGQVRSSPLPVSNSRALINYRTDGAVRCRQAPDDDANGLRRRQVQSLHIISVGRSRTNQNLAAETTGLQIVLRGTDQLENYPAAKAAFLTAAAQWESLIATSMTIVIDVDFGPTWFGERFGTSVLGQTDSQDLGDSSIYTEVRAALASVGSGDYRAAL